MELPGMDWVKVKTILAGICGTDMHTVTLRTSPYYAPLASFPYTFGHENIGTISSIGDQITDWSVGERVIVEPLLWCLPRGFTELCTACARGDINQCERFTEGNLSPGILIGGCREPGGSWSPYFTAHISQLYRVPESLSDENGLMIEPLATGLHAALRDFPEDEETVLIVGAGTIGLCTLAALRALGCQAKILVLARYPFQAQAAEKLGASQILIGSGNVFKKLGHHIYARILQPMIGKPYLVGGVDRIYECVGTPHSLDQSFRMVRAGGKVVLVAAPAMAKTLDWTTIFARELDLKASFCYSHAEYFQEQHWKTFDLAIHLMMNGKVDLGWMITHRYQLQDYRKAFQENLRRGRKGIIKAVFDFK